MDNLLRKRFYLFICFGYMSNHYFEMDIYKSITAPRQLKTNMYSIIFTTEIQDE